MRVLVAVFFVLVAQLGRCCADASVRDGMFAQPLCRMPWHEGRRRARPLDRARVSAAQRRGTVDGDPRGPAGRGHAGVREPVGGRDPSLIAFLRTLKPAWQPGRRARP